MILSKPLVLALVLLPGLAPAARAQASAPEVQVAADAAEAALVGETPFLAGRLLLRVADGVDLETLRASWNAERYAVVEPLMPSIGLYLASIADGTRVADAIRELAPMPEVRYAAPDHVVTARSTEPNDPSYASQWCHDKMESALAWDLGTGSGDYVVSVVDGGCLLTHDDLEPNVYVNLAESTGLPGVDDDGNGYVDDLHGWNAYSDNGNVPNDGHGTHCNGIVGAVGNNGLGVAGVNWTVTLMPVAGSSGSTSVVTKAYEYARAQKQLWLDTFGAQGANVVATNSSFGVDFADCSSPAYLPWNDAYDALGAVGILSCAATMNINVDVDVVGDTPTGCTSPFLVAVTNTTSADVKNSGAAYGARTIDLGAPGTSIYSTYSNGGYTNMTGTSMASPQVAGTIGFLHSVASGEFATLRDKDPSAAALALKEMILANVDPLPDLAGRTVSGGRLNLFQAAQAAHDWTSGETDGTVVAYGTGLGGANIATLASSSVPNLGTTLAIDLADFAGSSAALVLVGTAPDSLPLLGGTLLVDPATWLDVVGVPLTAGAGTVSFPLTANPAFVGFVADLQAVASDPGQPLGVAWSHGLEVTVGQ